MTNWPTPAKICTIWMDSAECWPPCMVQCSYSGWHSLRIDHRQNVGSFPECVRCLWNEIRISFCRTFFRKDWAVFVVNACPLISFHSRPSEESNEIAIEFEALSRTVQNRVSPTSCARNFSWSSVIFVSQCHCFNRSKSSTHKRLDLCAARSFSWFLAMLSRSWNTHHRPFHSFIFERLS